MSFLINKFNSMKRYVWMCSNFHRLLFFYQRTLTSKNARDRSIRLVQKLTGRKFSDFPGESRFCSEMDLEMVLDDLNRQGYGLLGKLVDSGTIEEIKQSIVDLEVCDYLVDTSKYSKITDLPEPRKSAMYRREDLARIDPIMRIANDPNLLETVQEYLGGRPVLSNVLLWWSYPSSNAVGPQNFHRDVDDFRFVKLFVYMSDVDESTGPHVYVTGSHVDDDATMRVLRRYSDDEIENHYGRDAIVTLVGEKGTAFLADSYGFHKGNPPISGIRMLLQFQWSLLPIGIEEYKPIQYKPTYPYNRQVNRLLIK